MSVYASRYVQPLLNVAAVRDVDGVLVAATVPEPSASVLVRIQGGGTATIYSARTMSAGNVLANPVPTGVGNGVAGVDALGNLVFWAPAGDEAGSYVYEAVVTVGAETPVVVPIPTLPRDAAEPVAGMASQIDLTAEVDRATAAEAELQEALDGKIGDTGVQDAAPSRLRFKSDPWADPTHPDWGAVGDGVADDSAALNAMFAAVGAVGGRVVMPAGKNFRVASHLFAFGRTDIEFAPGATITLDANLTATAAGDMFFINLGIPSKGAAGQPWIGRWRGGTVTGTAAAVAQRMIQVHAAKDFFLEDIDIDLRPITSELPSGIGGYNDSSWCTSPTRSYGHIERVHVRAAQSAGGGEGIGQQLCSYLWVRDCVVDGVGDDPLGLHACDHVTVDGFKAKSTHGRMYLSNIADFSIDDFYLERIPKASDGLYVGGGGLLELTIEEGYIIYPAPSRGSITSGELVLPNGIPSSTYMARLRGLRDVDVNGMLMRCGTTNHNSGISLESVTVASWADPQGIEPSTKARVRNTTIKGVHTIGSVDVGVQQTGAADDFVSPVTVDNSVVGPPLFYVEGTVWTPVNRVRSGSPVDLHQLHGQCVPNATLLFEGAVALADGFAAVKVARTTGLTRWYPNQPGLVTAISIETAADQTAGDTYVQIAKNGAATPEVIFINQSANPRGQRAGLYENVQNKFAGPGSATITNKALTSNVATLTTSVPHKWSVGTVVTVAGVDATFNGTYSITAATAKTFSYAKTAADVASVAATGTATTTGDYLEIVTQSSGLLPTPLQAWVKVYGLYA